MNRKLLSIPLLICTLLLLALLWLVGAARADLEVNETLLNQESGYAYEINADLQGWLWVSDNGAGEVRAYNPATNVYTTFLSMGAPSDARRAPGGEVWWVDQATDQLGMLDPSSDAVTRWDIPAASPFGTAVVSSGAVWVTDFFQPDLYRFDPGTNQLCTYTYGNIGASDYILAHNGQVWLGDWINNAIHRLEISSGQLTTWELPFDARPVGLTMDSQGHFWWADSDRGEVGRLEPGLDRLTVFDPPGGGTPEMVASSSGRVWYTDDSFQLLGILDPQLAAGSSQVVSTTETTLTPSCATISPASSGTVTSTSDTVSWSSANYTTTVDADGWLIHELPTDAYPWGIAANSGEVWFVDNGRQVLSRIVEKPRVSACKLEDGDGDLGTTDDQAPYEGWTVYLVVDGERQLPGQLTRANGCYTWYDLETGQTYGVEEEVLEGWEALTPTSHSFGVVQMGEMYQHTFINLQTVQVTACKLEDVDGDLGTSGDQTPLPDWPISLYINDALEEMQLSGSNGCYTWDGLLPGASYQVAEGSLPGWFPLGPTSHDFGLAGAGDQFDHAFINTQGQAGVYLPILLKVY
jgi:streptogramin lyase